MLETKESITRTTLEPNNPKNPKVSEDFKDSSEREGLEIFQQQSDRRQSTGGLFHSNKDIWDKTAALAPILSGVMIFATGFYCTYNYNQQQLKIQEVQTIEKFIPHLMGSEQSKKAAIMALSSLTNTETAGKVAQIFASSGTVQALQSLSQNGSERDKAVATQALSKALENLAERENKLTSIEEDYKRAIEARDKKAPNDAHPDTPYNLNKLAQLYTIRGQYDLAEPLLKRALAIREKIYGGENQEVADSLKSLAELYQLSNKHELAEATLKRAHGIEEKLVASGASIKSENAEAYARETEAARAEAEDTVVVSNTDSRTAGQSTANENNRQLEQKKPGAD
jgi:hypothetical protein